MCIAPLPPPSRARASAVLLLLAGLVCAVQSCRAEPSGAAPTMAAGNARADRADTPADAAAPSREARLQALMDATGARKRLEERIDGAVARARTDAERMLRDATEHLTLDAAMRLRLQQALEHHVDEVGALLRREVRGTSWIAEYDKAFSDEELDRLLAFYQSPLHAREAVVAEDATARMEGEVDANYARLSARSSRNYLQELRRLVHECACGTPRP